MPLEFDTARLSVPAAPQRTDIACFVGYVGLRNLPLPRQVTEDLRVAGWIDGPWRRDDEQIRSLTQLPVTVESWEALTDLRLALASAVGGDRCRRARAILARRCGASSPRVDAGPSSSGPAIRGRSSKPRGPGRPTVSRASRRWCRSSSWVRVRSIPPIRAPGAASSTCMDWPQPASSACPISPTPPPAIRAPPDVTLPLVPVSEGFVECSHSEEYAGRQSRAAPPSRAAQRRRRTDGMDQRDCGDARLPRPPSARRSVRWRTAPDGQCRGSARSAGVSAASRGAAAGRP